MDIDRLQELIERPSESLAIEYKGWISADSIEGTAKIIRTAIAIRNYGGGYIVFGFKNTGEPDLNNAPENNETIKTIFHIDKIQGMITRHSSEPFDVKMHYRTLKGIDFPTFPIIEIPSGIKSPVAAKSCARSGPCRPHRRAR